MDTQEPPEESRWLQSSSLDAHSDSPPPGPDLGATDARDAQVHDHNCAGGCGGRGYRYPNATAEEAEECTGRPYRFILSALDEDTGAVRTVLATDSTEVVTPWLDGDDPCTWVTDREFVPPPPVDLVKYDDCPF